MISSYAPLESFINESVDLFMAHKYPPHPPSPKECSHIYADELTTPFSTINDKVQCFFYAIIPLTQGSKECLGLCLAKPVFLKFQPAEGAFQQRKQKFKIKAIDATNSAHYIRKEVFQQINAFHSVLCTNLTPASHTRDYIFEETKKNERTYRFCPLKFDRSIQQFTLHQKYLNRAYCIYSGNAEYPSSSNTHYYINTLKPYTVYTSLELLSLDDPLYHITQDESDTHTIRTQIKAKDPCTSIKWMLKSLPPKIRHSFDSIVRISCVPLLHRAAASSSPEQLSKSFLPETLLQKHFVKATFYERALMIQPIMHQFEAACLHLAFFRFCPVYIREKHLTRATNPPCNGTVNNYEAYETYGDSILKLLATLFIYYYGEVTDTKLSEKEMTRFVAARVNNELLARIAAEDVRGIIKAYPAVAQHWKPPHYIKAKKHPLQTPSAPSTVADVVEAIIAATYLTNLDIESCSCLVSNLKIVPDIRQLLPVRYSLEKSEFLIGYGASSIKEFKEMLAQQWSYVKLFEKAEQHMSQLYQRGCSVISGISSVFKLQDESGLQELQIREIMSLTNLQKRILNYSFRDEELLRRALTAPSETTKFTYSYQRLEVLGDAILDCIVMCTTAQLQDLQTAEAVQWIKSHTVRNTTLGKLSLLLGLPYYARSLPSPSDYPNIKSLTFSQELKISKKYADFLEAVIGAVFADSRSLTVTSQVFAPLFLPIILYHLKFKSNKGEVGASAAKSLPEITGEICFLDMID